MKTPMQELIEDLKNNMVISIFERLEREGIFIKALEKEKHHIQMAFNDGRVTGSFKRIKNSDDYYNETYNQNK